jgi:hypothetical protein
MVFFFEVGWAAGEQQFSLESKKSRFFRWVVAPARIYIPYKLVRGYLTSP